MSSGHCPRSLYLQQGGPGRPQDRQGAHREEQGSWRSSRPGGEAGDPCLRAHRRPASSVWDERRFGRHTVGTGPPGYTLTKWASVPHPASLSVTASQELQDRPRV